MSGAQRKPAAREHDSQTNWKPPRSVEELTRLIDQDPTANFQLSATELMMLTGSPQKDGFSATPPSQPASLMDADEPDDIRVVGCVLDHTSRGGEGTRGRTPFARMPDGGLMKRKEIAAKLELPMSKANPAVDLAIAKKRIREDDKGRIWTCGQVPAPKLKRSGRIKSELLCTKSRPKYLLKRLQQLTEHDRSNYERNQERLNAAENEAIAEVTAQVREAFEPLHEQLLATVGVKPVKLKKRREETPRKEPQLKITLQLKFPDFEFVQSCEEESVQNPDPASYKPKSEPVQTENDFVQSEQPYRESEREREESRDALPNTSQKPRDEPTEAARVPVLANLLFAAMNAPLPYGAGERRDIEAEFNELSADERIAAVEGIRIRQEIGEYANPRFNPSLLNYLRKKSWTAALRVDRGKKKADTSYLDDVIAKGASNAD